MRRFIVFAAKIFWSYPVIGYFLILVSAVGLFATVYFTKFFPKAWTFWVGLLFFFLLVLSHAFKNESIIRKIEIIFKKNPEFTILNFLLGDAKAYGKFGKLKNWLKNFKEHESVRKKLLKLEKKREKMAEKISRNMEKMAELQTELAISFNKSESSAP